MTRKPRDEAVEEEGPAPERLADVFELEVVAGPGQGRKFGKAGGSFRLKRTKKSLPDVFAIMEPSVSEEHGVVEWTGEAWVFQDLGSTNGSTINGERVEPGCSYPLKTGDVLGLGDVVKLAIRVIPGDPARMTVEEFARAQANLLEQKIHLAARKSKQELREQGLALKRAILSQLNH